MPTMSLELPVVEQQPQQPPLAAAEVEHALRPASAERAEHRAPAAAR